MKINLYSQSHLNSANKLGFPINDPVWLNEIWTEEEINKCKFIEMNEFIHTPSMNCYPGKSFLLNNNLSNTIEEIHIINNLINKRGDIKSFLSIGCGIGQKEILLAIRNPQIKFKCIDNAPYVERINLIVKDMGLKNIEFINNDFSYFETTKFDICYADSIDYCLKNDSLTNFYLSLQHHLTANGIIILANIGNFSLINKFWYFLYPKTFKSNGRKLIGYMRDKYEIKKFFPKTFNVINIYSYYHHHQVPLKAKFPFLAKIIIYFSRNIYPLSNAGLMFIINKKRSINI